MAGNISCILLLSVLVLSSIVSGRDQNVTALYLFGDGLLDVGNNNYLKNVLFKANFPPNGIDGGKNIARTRFSNGKNYADFLAKRVGLKTSRAYHIFIYEQMDVLFPLRGVNCASGGAGILKGKADPLRFSKQLKCFSAVYDELEEKLGSAEARISHLQKSLFIVAIGAHDIIDYYKSGSHIPHKPKPEDYVGSMLRVHENVLKKIYLNGGGESKYVVIGSGPVGCVPFMRNQNKGRDCDEEANNMARMFNEGLKTMLTKLSSEGFRYSFINEYSVVWDFIQRPTDFGFAEFTVGCCRPGVNIHPEMPCEPFSEPCSNRTDHLFWDQYHLTEAATKRYMDLVFEGSEPYVFPINIKQLIEA